MHILSGKSKVNRQGERERDVFFLNFVIFFYSLLKILIDEMSLSDCITL